MMPTGAHALKRMHQRIFLCIYCGHPADQIDPIHPRSRSDADKPSNRAPACKSCNSAKANRSVERFLRQHPLTLARVCAYHASEDVFAELIPGAKPQAPDDRVTTTVRISPEGLEALKNVAAAKRARVNDLLIEAADYVLHLYGKPAIVQDEHARFPDV